jgi:hypothetical protein
MKPHRGASSCCTGSQTHDGYDDPPPVDKAKPRKYVVVWSGRTARECDSSTMMCINEAYWDNYHFITLHVLDKDLLRIVHAISVPIDEAEGWTPTDTVERIGAMKGELETLLQQYASKFEHGEMRWSDLQI